MNLKKETTEKILINPMEYDFGDISHIPKAHNGNLLNNDKSNDENEVSTDNQLTDALDVSKKLIKIEKKIPTFYDKELWKQYQISFPWLYYNGKRFLCSYCQDAFDHAKGMIQSNWMGRSNSKVISENPTKDNIAKRRFEKHGQTNNHLIADKYFKQPHEFSDWQKYKDKYTWLEGDMENTRCLLCEQAYKRHKDMMIVTIWTCPELKNKQSPTHFSVSHRLDRHEKCKNHLLAVKLEGTTGKSKGSAYHRLTNCASLSSRISSKSPPKLIKRNRKSTPVKSCKASGIVLPFSITEDYFMTLKTRYTWLECHDEISFLCKICDRAACHISFDRDSTLSFISRKILSHCHSEAHIQTTQSHTESSYVTRLQRGSAIKIDYKRLSSGMDDGIVPVVTVTSPKKAISNWSCPQCKSYFVKIPSLIEHIGLCDFQSPKVVKELSCPCNGSINNFSTIIKLDLHAAQDHSDQLLFNCYICSDRFSRLLLLYNHMLVHHLIDWDPFETYVPASLPPPSPKCVFCSTEFSSNIELTGHYCDSACMKYLQPSLQIEKLEGDQHIASYQDVTEIVPLIVPRVRKYRSYPKKVRHESVERAQTIEKSENESQPNKSVEPLPVIRNRNSLSESSIFNCHKEKNHRDKIKNFRNLFADLARTTEGDNKTHSDTEMENSRSKEKNLILSEVIEKKEKESKKSDKSEISEKNIPLKTQPNVSVEKKPKRSVLPEKSTTDSNIAQQYLSKRRNCRSIFSRRLSDPEMEIKKPVEEKEPEKVVGQIKHVKSHSSKTIPEIEDFIDFEETEEKIKKRRRKKSEVKKSVNIANDEKVSDKQKNQIIKLVDECTKAAEVNVQNPEIESNNNNTIAPNIISSPDKRIESLYLDKLKEMRAQFSWEISSNLNDSKMKNSVKKGEIKPNLYTKKLAEISPTFNEELKKKTADQNEKEKAAENRKSLMEKKLLEMGITVCCTETDDSDLHRTFDKVIDDVMMYSSNENKYSGLIMDNYEIISLGNVEPKIGNKKEVSLNELKVCLEKTDIVEEQMRLRNITERRKQISLNKLRVNLCPSLTAPENEKRARIPTEKLRESFDYVDKQRQIRKLTSDRDSDDDVTDDKKNRRKLPSVSTSETDDDKSRGKNAIPPSSNRKRGFGHRSSDIQKANKIQKGLEDKATAKTSTDSIKYPKMSNLLIENADRISSTDSPDEGKSKRSVVIQSQGSPPAKSGSADGQLMTGELSFMDRMKKIRQLKKIRTEQQREQMMAVDRTVAQINEQSLYDSTILAKSDKIQKLLTCEQYSMSDLKNILRDGSDKGKLVTESEETEKGSKLSACKQYSMTDLKNILQEECRKRKLSDGDEYRPPKSTKLDSSPRSQKMESQRGKLMCEVCNEVFRSLRARDKHLVEEHRGLKLFRCKMCDVSVATHLALRKHASKYHPNFVASIVSGHEVTERSTNYQCHSCSVQCISKPALLNHITSVHRSVLNKPKPTIETAVSNSLPVVVVDDFVSKLKNANPANSYQACSICNELMNNDFELAIHTVEHDRETDQDMEANQFACPKCCRLFFGREGKTYLKDHYNIVHLEKPVPSCDECSTEFPSTWCYYEHKRTQKNCAKKTADQMVLSADPYGPLNDAMRLAFVCSRCQALVAGDSAQVRFEQHQIDCSLQNADGDGVAEEEAVVVEEEDEEEEEEESLVVDETAPVAAL